MECTNILQIIEYGYKKKLRKCDVLKIIKNTWFPNNNQFIYSGK